MNKTTRNIRHGPDPADMGGINIESQYRPDYRCTPSVTSDDGEEPPSEVKRFLGYFVEELKEQIRGKPAQRK